MALAQHIGAIPEYQFHTETGLFVSRSSWGIYTFTPKGFLLGQRAREIAIGDYLTTLRENECHVLPFKRL